MAGSDWFSQYAQNFTKPSSSLQNMLQPGSPLPSTAAGRPGNLLQAMGTSGFTNPNAIPNSQPNNVPTLGAPDFLHNLFNQLLANSQSSYHQPSAAEILQQATHTAAAQYDPQISAINRQMGRAKNTAGKNKAEIGKLYAAGADAYNGDMAAGKQTGAAAVADEKSRQNDLQTKLSGDYSKSMDAQSKEFANLGISSALPQATQSQQSDLKYLSNLNATQGNANLSDLNMENTGDQQYFNEGKGIMRLTGNQAQSDLMTQLTDYLNSQGDAKTSIEGQRQSAIATLQNQLTQQAATQAQQSQTSDWGNMYKLAGLYQQMNPQKQATSGLNAASQYLASKTTPQKAQDTMSALHLLLGTPAFTQGRVPTGQKDASGNPTYTKLTPEAAAHQGVDYATHNGWAPADQMGLMQAILAYYGRMGG